MNEMPPEVRATLIEFLEQVAPQVREHLTPEERETLDRLVPLKN